MYMMLMDRTMGSLTYGVSKVRFRPELLNVVVTFRRILLIPLQAATIHCAELMAGRFHP